MNRIEYYNIDGNKYNITEEKRNLVIIGSPNHGNMGDVAITWSTIKLLELLYPNDNVFDVTMEEFPFEIDAIYHLLKPKDIVILQGGGNLGNIYPDDEMIRRYVISRFRKNRLIMFPQSIYFSNDLKGEKELEICSDLYSANKNLYMLARDGHSYEIMRKYFNVPSEHIVDVVLTQKVGGGTLRKGALVCFRGDKEGILSVQNKKEITEIVRSVYNEVITTDTVIEFDGNKDERYGRLTDKLDEFRNAEVVVTDRLHGLIFSIITDTPCVVLPTVNTKITSAFDDLGMADGIFLIESVGNLKDILENLRTYSNIEYDNTLIVKQYRDLLENILKNNLIEEYEMEETADKFELSSYWDYKAYESDYWKNNIKSAYDNLQKDNQECVNEMSVYKEWVSNLEKQKKELISQYNDTQVQLETINTAYQNQGKSLDDRLKELAEYEMLVFNLQAQNDELKNQIHHLEKNFENLKLERNHAQRNYLETQEQLTISINEIKELKDEESNRKRQFDIQLRELYDNVKNERENRIKTVSEFEEKIRGLDREKNDLETIINQLKCEKESNSRGVLSKTVRCLRLYGVRHTIRSCMLELKKKK